MPEETAATPDTLDPITLAREEAAMEIHTPKPMSAYSKSLPQFNQAAPR